MLLRCCWGVRGVEHAEQSSSGVTGCKDRSEGHALEVRLEANNSVHGDGSSTMHAHIVAGTMSVAPRMVFPPVLALLMRRITLICPAVAAVAMRSTAACHKFFLHFYLVDSSRHMHKYLSCVTHLENPNPACAPCDLQEVGPSGSRLATGEGAWEVGLLPHTAQPGYQSELHVKAL